ncbi:PIN domain-containing protein [Legionella gresilensis]|uniref:PIN domain-containing protein n=1 Tax=Legionella gresilensis TaxID=91823 RepID=UPI001041595A|nr:PIN domain-containing protein [Legionella gresilensis]
MPLLGNCLIFLDTGFFTNYKPNDNLYDEVWKRAKNDGLKLCTSWICIEEWKSQKIKHLTKFLKDMRDQQIYHCRQNFFSQKLILEPLYAEFENEAYVRDKVEYLLQDFLKSNKIKIYPAKDEHIPSTWNGYFTGAPPFQKIKNKEDLPDAWVFEGAKNALNDPEHNAFELKYCISTDGALSKYLSELGYTSIKLNELIEILRKEELEVVDEPVVQPQQQVILVNDEIEMGPLDKLLTKTVLIQDSEIYLRLLGYLVALDAPTHETLLTMVSSRGYDSKRVEACAVMLSGEPNPYIKDLGTHYIVGNKEVCHAASKRVMDEIIGMLE